MGTTEGAMPSVIGNEGFVCKYGDVKDLTTRLKAVFDDSKRMLEMGKRGNSKVLANFTWQVIGEKAKQAIERAYGRKKVLICSNSYPPKFIGGAELIAHNQAKILKKRGQEVAVFAGVFDQKAIHYSLEELIFEGIPIRRVCLHHSDYNADFTNLCHREVEDQFNRMLDDFSPDVVHFHNIIGLSVGLPKIARQRKLKTVLTLHDYWAICHRNTTLKADGKPCIDFKSCEACPSHISDDNWESMQLRMRRDYISLQLQNMHTVISPSQYLARIYDTAGLFSDKVQIIPNGVDVDRFRMVKKKSNPKVVRFSFIGHLGPHKGVRTIIEALPFVMGRRRFRLNIVGEGWQQPELERMAWNVGMQNRVAFWGKVQNRHIKKVYEKTDVLILPSIWPENQPVSITEAMACGLPVIAARVGGIPELVDDGKTGYLFEAGNPKDLAHKMSVFLTDASKITQFGRNGFMKIAAYNIETQVDRIVEYYFNSNAGAGVPDDKNVIACIGNQIQPECVAGFNRFVKNSENECKLVLGEWLDGVGLENARLLWVLDKNVEPKTVGIGLKNKLPLLFPDEHTRLKALCQREKCGLSYRADPIEIETHLKFLIENETVRESMAKNALRAFYTDGLC
jgi:glycosyltransferase involved in cell wall biosynthesis